MLDTLAALGAQRQLCQLLAGRTYTELEELRTLAAQMITTVTRATGESSSHQAEAEVDDDVRIAR